MSSDNNINVFKPSVLERLLNAKDVRYGQTLSQLEDSILSDLQDLLNTRSPPQDYFTHLDAIQGTVANYGLMDFAHVECISQGGRQRVLDHIKTIIETFEPRLIDVKVTERQANEVEKVAKKDFHKGAIYFQVKARLNGDPAPDVSFETILELARGSHVVKKDLS